MEEKNQQIHCTVGSCMYNNCETKKCLLEAINVAPMQGNNSKQADESMCASYQYGE